MTYLTGYNSPLGLITIASDGEAVTGLWFDSQKYDRSTVGKDFEWAETAVFAEARAWLDRYFEGGDPGATPPLKVTGSPFRLRISEIMRSIPYGKTMTYGEISALAGGCAQAVGGAVGHNPISIMIPCHRVVGTGGSLTGYAGGLDRKRALLDLERKNLVSLSLQ